MNSLVSELETGGSIRSKGDTGYIRRDGIRVLV